MAVPNVILVAAIGVVMGSVGCIAPPPALPAVSETSSTAGSSGTDDGAVPTTNTAVDTTGPGPNATNATNTDTTSGPGTSSFGSSSTGPGMATTGGEGALVISDGPTFDFGDLPLDTNGVQLFVVSNVGDGPVVDMAGSPVQPPFGYVGGSYPGDGGDCGAALDPMDDCSVAIEFAPTSPGLAEETFWMTVSGRDAASRPLQGGGVGQSDNLLVNPGGEMAGEPPPGWSNVGPGAWIAGVFQDENFPFSGANYIAGDQGPNSVPFVLRQEISVDAWASTIDRAAMRFDFDGYGRSFMFNNDDFRFTLTFEDAMGTELEEWTTGWEDSDNWQGYGDSRIVAPSTRVIGVELSCRKFNGQYCQAYFDELSLRAAYP